MTTTTNNGNGPRLPFSVIVPTASLILMAFGGVWVLMQSQFVNVAKNMEDRDKAIVIQQTNTEREIETDRRQFTANYDRITKLLNDASDELKSRVADIHGELRHDLVSQLEFKQFEKQLDELREQFRILETTRPTTGELSSASVGLEKRIDAISERLNKMEDRAQQHERDNRMLGHPNKSP